MPPIQSASATARNKNIKAEMAAGKPRKPAVAIAYAIQRGAEAKGRTGITYQSVNQYNGQLLKTFERHSDRQVATVF